MTPALFVSPLPLTVSLPPSLPPLLPPTQCTTQCAPLGARYDLWSTLHKTPYFTDTDTRAYELDEDHPPSCVFLFGSYAPWRPCRPFAPARSGPPSDPLQSPRSPGMDRMVDAGLGALKPPRRDLEQAASKKNFKSMTESLRLKFFFGTT